MNYKKKYLCGFVTQFVTYVVLILKQLVQLKIITQILIYNQLY